MADEPLPEVGLCSVCVHARIVRTPRSRFWMCRLSATDPEFARYPRLPVLRCSGHQRGRPSEGSTEER